jgi:hypothetical protein
MSGTCIYSKAEVSLQGKAVVVVIEEKRNDCHDSTVPDEEIFLMDQSRKLYSAWSRFCKQLPDGQKAGLLTEPPSLSQLYQSVQKATSSWQEAREKSRTGRLKSVFSNFCQVMEDHSHMLSVVPVNDRYASLLTGSVTAIAQVSPPDAV